MELPIPFQCLYNDSVMELPLKYQKEIRELLKDEYPEYLSAMQEEPVHSLRVNTSRTAPEQFENLHLFDLRRVPWCSSGFYYPADIRPGTDPYYYAGLYYMQEASAMVPAEILPVEEGNIILDACAAPGGKSTRLAEKLHGTGVLVSNDISASRQNATLRNLERFGMENTYVISEDLTRMQDRFPETFDRILVDAPCSGEGMFRKEPSLIASWQERDSSYYAPLQKEILCSAWKMLKKGGKLVYSTCTFDPEENEKVLAYLKEQDPSMAILPVADRDPGWMPGILPGYENCVRLYPHHIAGEGHFCALLQKGGTAEETESYHRRKEALPGCVREFLEMFRIRPDEKRIMIQKDRVYVLPPVQLDMQGIRVLRSGLLLGTVKKDRFEPAQALAYTLKPSQCAAPVILAHDDIRAEKFLRGETIAADFSYNGWTAVFIDEYPLGFAKMQGTSVKNKIEKGYRML